jgi:Rad3-related DNA helicase
MTKTEIKEKIEEEEKSLGIVLRPQQIDACNDILTTFLIDGIKTYILEAPTGSGKSVIGVVVSNILNKMSKKGYMLTSDLLLQDQYRVTIASMNQDYGNVKGVDNYNCTRNLEKHSLGECHTRGFESKEIKNLPCYKTCPYYSARDHAARASTSVLNYNYWLIQLDYVKTHMTSGAAERLFTEREFTIFDEAHKIPDIVQSHFAPRFNIDIAKNIDILDKHLHTNKLSAYVALEKNLYQEEDKTKLVAILNDIYTLYSRIISQFDKIKEWVNVFYINKSPLPPTLNEIVQACDFMEDIHCKLEDYLKFISDTGMVSMLKNKKSDEELVFNFINEYWLIRKNLLNISNYRLFMSATLGRQFDQIIGLNEKFVYKSLDSDFEFKNSDIFVYPNLSLNFKSKAQNYPKLMRLVDKILDKHLSERGVIHTANYEIMDYIVQHSRHKNRLLSYRGSKEKEKALMNHNKGTNTVLMGPSIFEGVDLKDNLSKFQIITKIPYPSLGDAFIKYKFDNNRSAYEWSTQLKIQQALGRSIRHKHDNATSYILDSNLRHFLENFPDYITNRIKELED